MKMKTTFFLPLVFLSQILICQINAGEVVEGTSSFDPNVLLENSESWTTITDSIDLDCDGIDDLELRLYNGAIEIDDVNGCTLKRLNENLEICGSGDDIYFRPQYYSFSSEMTCMGDFDWVSDSTYGLGNFGGWIPLPPSLIEDEYIAFRMNAGTVDEAYGWINISFNLEVWDLTAEIHEVLILCEPSHISEEHFRSSIVFPNPTSDGYFTIEGVRNEDKVQLFDAMGREIPLERINKGQFKFDSMSGYYSLRIVHEHGIEIVKLLKT